MADLLDVNCARERCLLCVVAFEKDAMLFVRNAIGSDRWVMAKMS